MRPEISTVASLVSRAVFNGFVGVWRPRYAPASPDPRAGPVTIDQGGTPMTYHEGRHGPGSGTADRLDLDPASPEQPGQQVPGQQLPGTPLPDGPSLPPLQAQTPPAGDSPPGTAEHTSTTDTAKEEASKVAAETKRQVRDLSGRTREQVASQAQQQKERAVGGLRALSEELNTISGSSPESGVAGDLAHEAARRTDEFAGWLESREPGELIDEVRTFARQRPGLFLALAAGAGVLAGRLTRGVAQPEAAQDAPS
jgi:hypothetical protein